MIDSVEMLSLDISGLKNSKEIENYIPTQLQKYYPDPNRLIFDYALQKRGERKSVLVTYILRERVDDFKGANHPVLLFRDILKKDGHYVVVYSSSILEVIIRKGVVISSNKLKLELNSLKEYGSDIVLICDNQNRVVCQNYFNGEILSLENLYKKCRANLFLPKRKSPMIPLLSLLLIGSIFWIVNTGLNEYNRVLNELKRIEGEYNTLLLEDNKARNRDNQYNELLDRLYTLQSQVEPDIYSIFYELGSSGKDFKITNFNYSGKKIRLNVITKNGSDLVNSLNRSHKLNLVHNSSVKSKGLEQVNITGDVICP